MLSQGHTTFKSVSFVLSELFEYYHRLQTAGHTEQKCHYVQTAESGPSDGGVAPT